MFLHTDTVLSLAWPESGPGAEQSMVLLPPGGQKRRQSLVFLLHFLRVQVYGGSGRQGWGTRTWFPKEVVQISVNRSTEGSWKSGMGTAIFLKSLEDNWTPFSYRVPLGAAIRKRIMGG